MLRRFRCDDGPVEISTSLGRLGSPYFSVRKMGIIGEKTDRRVSVEVSFGKLEIINDCPTPHIRGSRGGYDRRYYSIKSTFERNEVIPSSISLTAGKERTTIDLSTDSLEAENGVTYEIKGERLILAGEGIRRMFDVNEVALKIPEPPRSVGNGLWDFVHALEIAASQNFEGERVPDCLAGGLAIFENKQIPTGHWYDAFLQKLGRWL